MLNSFGHLLKGYRLSKGMTQKELADAVGVNGSYIARLERDERRPSRKVVLSLAKALDLPPEDSDRLLASAQHLPEGDMARIIEQSGISLTHPAVEAVAVALQDKDLSPHAREQLENEVIAYVTFRAQQLRQQEHDRHQRAKAH
ncbi:MAG: helix-turn-helix transcriptional regulator [Anaerolineae bacterium]